MPTWREKKLNEIYFGIFASDAEIEDLEKLMKEVAVDQKTEEKETTESKRVNAIVACLGPARARAMSALMPDQKAVLRKALAELHSLDVRIEQVFAKSKLKVQELTEQKVTPQGIIDGYKEKLDAILATAAK